MLKLMFILIMVLFIPFGVSAENKNIRFSDLDKVHKFDVGQLEFEEFKFIDNSLNQIYNFGIVGELENKSDESTVLKTTVKYYTENKVLVLSNIQKMQIDAHEIVSFAHMLDANLVNSKYEVKDIKLYTVEIDVVEGTLSSDSEVLSSSGKYNDLSYLIDSYHVDITINSDRTMLVKERFEVFSNGPHKIEKNIPLKNSLKLNNGVKHKVYGSVLNLTSNKEFRKKFSDDNLILQFFKNDNITGTKIYEISYSYDNGYDPYRENDGLCFDLLNNSYNIPIGNMTFTVTYPDKIVASQVGLTLRGSVDEDKELQYKVVDNMIVGKLEGVLDSGNSIFLSSIFEDKYFTRNVVKDLLIDYSVFLIPCLMLIFAFILWIIFGKDRKSKVVYSPILPNGLTSTEAALIYKGEVTSKDIISMLISLANRKYIEISYVGDNGTSSIKNLTITKLKEYDGKDDIEKQILEMLFYAKQIDIAENMLKSNYKKGRASRKLNKLASVNRKEIIDVLINSLPIILENANSVERYDKIYEKKSTIAGKFAHILAFIVALSGIVIPVYYYAGSSYALGSMFIVLMSGVAIELVLSKKLNRTLKSIAFGIFIIMVIMFLYLPIAKALIHKASYEVGVIFGLVTIIGIIEFVNIMPKRTVYGSNMLGKLDGFKKILESSSVETVVNAYKEYDYFYEILSFSSALNLSENWYKNFNGLIDNYPSWFKSNKTFQLKTVYKDLIHLVNYIDKSSSVSINVKRK